MSAIEDIKDRKVKRAQERAELDEFRAMKQAQQMREREVAEQSAYDLGATDASQAVEQLLSQRRSPTMRFLDKGIGAVSSFMENVAGPTPEEAKRNAQLGDEMRRSMEQELTQEAIFNAGAEGDTSENNINKHINTLKGIR